MIHEDSVVTSKMEMGHFGAFLFASGVVASELSMEWVVSATLQFAFGVTKSELPVKYILSPS